MKTIMEVILEISEEVDTIKQVVMEIRRTRLAQFKDEWIDGQEVMQSLYISKRTLQTLRDQEKLPYSRINGKFYYKVSDLETLLQSNYSHSKRTGHGDK